LRSKKPIDYFEGGLMITKKITIVLIYPLTIMETVIGTHLFLISVRRALLVWNTRGSFYFERVGVKICSRKPVVPVHLHSQGNEW
jgi:hypothetical protein